MIINVIPLKITESSISHYSMDLVQYKNTMTITNL